MSNGKTKQSFEIGATVKIGFMTGLRVIAKIPTPGDYAPDAYVLQNPKGDWYRFVPHNGLTRESSFAAACAA